MQGVLINPQPLSFGKKLLISGFIRGVPFSIHMMYYMWNERDFFVDIPVSIVL